MRYTDDQRIKKIYEYAVQLKNYIIDNGLTKEELCKDIHLQWLVTTPLYNIGEHAYYLSESFKKEHDTIEWDLISGLRHRLVHNYDGINWSIISDVVFDEIPVLVDNLKQLIDRTV